MPLPSGPTTPCRQRHQAIAPYRFRLFPFRSPLLRESRLFSLPRGTEMFQFPRFPLPGLCVQPGVTPHYGCRVSPFGHPRIEARSTAPRGFSQSPTSFIGFRRQGIHRWLFVAWRINKDARARYGVLKERGLTGQSRGRRTGLLPTTRRKVETGRWSNRSTEVGFDARSPPHLEAVSPATKQRARRSRAPINRETKVYDRPMLDENAE